MTGDDLRPRTFVLRRHEDETGVSTAHGAERGQDVAWGVEFPDGFVVIRWCVYEIRRIAVFASLADVEAVHGHNGKTEVVWLDEPAICGATLTPEDLFAMPPADAQRMADGICRRPAGQCRHEADR